MLKIITLFINSLRQIRNTNLDFINNNENTNKLNFTKDLLNIY